MTMQRSQRNAAEWNYFKNTSRRCDILWVQRHQQPERLLTKCTSVCVFLFVWERLGLISYLGCAHYKYIRSRRDDCVISIYDEFTKY